MLSPYRALDLTDEKGFLCGKLLSDLGCDVIKVEPPSGDPGRRIGPFYRDDPDPKKSLYWFAYNTGKRSVTLDIETADGRELYRRLARAADFIVESLPPGYLDSLGIGYDALAGTNPGLIMVSITPFGQDGPYREYKAPDIVAWAVGGYMLSAGDADRPPVQISHHSHAHLHAGAEAAVGAMLALMQRNLTGEGQQVDISLQEAIAQSVDSVTWVWDMMRINRTRSGTAAGGLNVPTIWPCKDGFVTWIYWFGLSGPWNLPLLDWMEEEGLDVSFLKGFDWVGFERANLTPEIWDRIAEPTLKFFMSHTRAELLSGALKHRAQLYPASTVSDIFESEQLADRDYWVELDHPELSASLTYPGSFAKSSVVPPAVSRRAPLIGEHNTEVFEKELGISRDALLTLKQAGVI